MKRIALLLLLTISLAAFAQPQRENRSIGENQHEAKLAAKQQQKYNKKTAKRQRKTMKNYQKQQRKAAKHHR